MLYEFVAILYQGALSVNEENVYEAFIRVYSIRGY